MDGDENIRIFGSVSNLLSHRIDETDWPSIHLYHFLKNFPSWPTQFRFRDGLADNLFELFLCTSDKRTQLVLFCFVCSEIFLKSTLPNSYHGREDNFSTHHY